ncbi:hypothetical protein, partial [Streptomyces europaeiscabiei]|uniref:hypothetical protein n=1 Tax=Streptomyces europaeiscabiei TaxID=146819 RepID=UPI0029ABE097
MRAAVFAVAGSVLALSGHHAVADGVPPWRLVTLLALAQFATVWPAAQRRFAPMATLGCTLGVQGLLHVALALADGPAGAGSSHLSHTAGPQAPAAPVSGPDWHQASGTMTAVHVLAALTVAWLLHRADDALATAVPIARAVRGAACAVVAWLSAGLSRVGPRPLPALEPIGCFAPSEPLRTQPLEHQLVRRGPPGHTGVPVVLCAPAGVPGAVSGVAR